MNDHSDDQLLLMQATIDYNRQAYDEKMKKLIEDLIAMSASIMDQIKILKFSPDKKDSPKAHNCNHSPSSY